MAESRTGRAVALLTPGFTCVDNADRPDGAHDDHDDRDDHEEFKGIDVVTVAAVVVVVRAVCVGVLNSSEILGIGLCRLWNHLELLA